MSSAPEVRTGRERYVPEVRFLEPRENHAVVSHYARHHPIAFRVLARAFGYPLRGTPSEHRGFAETLRFVAFRPRRDEAVSHRG